MLTLAKVVGQEHPVWTYLTPITCVQDVRMTSSHESPHEVVSTSTETLPLETKPRAQVVPRINDVKTQRKHCGSDIKLQIGSTTIELWMRKKSRGAKSSIKVKEIQNTIETETESYCVMDAQNRPTATMIKSRQLDQLDLPIELHFVVYKYRSEFFVTNLLRKINIQVVRVPHRLRCLWNSSGRKMLAAYYQHIFQRRINQLTDSERTIMLNEYNKLEHDKYQRFMKDEIAAANVQLGKRKADPNHYQVDTSRKRLSQDDVNCAKEMVSMASDI